MDCLFKFIIIPGDAGNQMYVKLNKTSAPHYICDLKTDDFVLEWLDISTLTPYYLDCLVDDLRLVYDNKSRTTSDSPGVQTLVKGFGQTDTIEYLDTSHLSVSAYFAHMVDALVTNYKSVRGVNVRGAPYDWRKAPNELDEYYVNLTQLVEDTYYVNNGTKVILVAHSMGNPVTLYWLNRIVSSAWKDKFLRSMVSLAGAWAGKFCIDLLQVRVSEFLLV